MKKVFGLTLILVLGVALVACSEKEGQLTRADVQKVSKEGNYETAITITDKENLIQLKDLLKM